MQRRIVATVSLILPVLAYAQDTAEDSRSYHYECVFEIYDAFGEFQSKMRIEATQTRGLPGGTVRWNGASIAFGSSRVGAFGPPMPQTYMDDFTYRQPEIEDMLTGDFFASFPTTPLGFLMKNSVLDAHVFDTFLDEVDGIELHVPYRSATSDSEITLYEDEGQQQLKDLILTWTGNSERNGELCKVIRYQSSLDSVSVDLPGSSRSGCTIFWGDLWVSSSTGRIEHATLFEHSLMGAPDSESPLADLQNIYRRVTLARTDHEDRGANK